MKKIITCPECGQKNISKLRVCNRCGAPLAPAKSKLKQQEDINTPDEAEGRPKEAEQRPEDAEHRLEDAEFSNLMSCPDCNRQVSINAATCPNCGAPISTVISIPMAGELVPAKKKTSVFTWLVTGFLALLVIGSVTAPDRHEAVKSSPTYEPTKASESRYEKDIRLATASQGLTKADLAWHAQNTYGWNCPEVVTRRSASGKSFYYIECSSGVRLRVYPRAGTYPRITNKIGGYE